MQRRTKWLLAAASVAIPTAGALLLYALAKQHAAKIEPYIRDQAVAYLRDRFQADVSIQRLSIGLPAFSPVKLYLSKGRGATASVTGEGVSLRQGAAELLAIRSLRFEVDLGQLDQPHKGVTSVTLDGVDITVPPKEDRPPAPRPPANAPPLRIAGILPPHPPPPPPPQNKAPPPLEFELHRVRFTDAGLNAPLNFEAELRNVTPPGQVRATGRFGPWDADHPSDTPLEGDYTFERANLAVFNAIGGVLDSTGHFSGRLNQITATGQATVPDFHLKSAGNKIPLATKFEVEVDGTNGNTVLQPVHGRLGQTAFTTSGGVIKHDGDRRRTIALDVHMPAARLEDLLLLAMKGSDPFMSGTLALKSKVLLPPLSGKVIEKLRLDGEFSITGAKFLRSHLQDRLDQMSRQAQGQPTNQAIDEVVSGMSGRFVLLNELLTLNDLAFSIPGADLKLDGSYNLDTEAVDFHGDLRLQAKLSQTQTGWKRWALKPVDPFFAKKGAGLYTKIQITGTRQNPKFGREK